MPDFFSAPVLGIDLGASFTKVSYRPGWTEGNRYDEPCRLVMIENRPLVPSLVIHKKGARKSWLCGQAAAGYRPLADDQVFTNWKADLFSNELTLRVGGSLKAAGEFFRWLHEKISDVGIDVAACRVKVCLPAFADIERPASILGQEMELAGWQNVTVSRVSEPRANTVGVFGDNLAISSMNTSIESGASAFDQVTSRTCGGSHTRMRPVIGWGPSVIMS